MKLVSCEFEGRTLAGMWFGERVLDLAAAGRRMNEPADLGSMLAIIRGGEARAGRIARIESRARGVRRGLAGRRSRVRLLAPIPAPLRNVFCVGRNYVDHVREGYARARQGSQIARSAAVLHQGDRCAECAERRRPARFHGHAPARLRSGAGGGHRHARPRHRRGAGLPPRLRLHRAQRLHRARPAAPPRAVVQGQVAGHHLPDRARGSSIARRSAIRPRWSCRSPSTASSASSATRGADDLRHPDHHLPRCRRA